MCPSGYGRYRRFPPQAHPEIIRNLCVERTTKNAVSYSSMQLSLHPPRHVRYVPVQMEGEATEKPFYYEKGVGTIFFSGKPVGTGSGKSMSSNRIDRAAVSLKLREGASLTSSPRDVYYNIII